MGQDMLFLSSKLWKQEQSS